MVETQQGLTAFRSYFLQLAPPQFILQHLPDSIAADFQSALYSTILNALSAPHPPPKPYLRRLLKALVTHLENLLSAKGTEDDELNDGLLELYTEYMSAPDGRPTERVPVRYIVPEKDVEVLILESPNLLSGAGTTGLRTWEAARALGELVAGHRSVSTAGSIPPINVRDKKVLELGAGTGFVSILAAKLGAMKVWATDGDEGVVQYLQQNIEVNGEGEKVVGFQKWWGESSVYDDELRGLDWIIAADVTYDPSIIPLLIKEIEDLNHKNSEAKIVVAATMRNFDTFECFIKGLDEAGFKTEQYTWSVSEKSLFYYQSSTPIKLVFISK